MFTDKAINLSSSVFSGATGMVLGLVALLAIVLAITAVYICNKYPKIKFSFDLDSPYDLSTGKVSSTASEKEISSYLKESEDIFKRLLRLDTDDFEKMNNAIDVFNYPKLGAYVYQSSNYTFDYNGKSYVGFFYKNKKYKIKECVFFEDGTTISKSKFSKIKRKFKKSL